MNSLRRGASPSLMSPPPMATSLPRASLSSIHFTAVWKLARGKRADG
jgi:hypothetical protein